MTPATGFDCQPLPDGNVLIEFFGEDGGTINKQVVTPDVIRHMPLVAALTDVAMRKGPEVAREIMEKLNRSITILWDFIEGGIPHPSILAPRRPRGF